MKRREFIVSGITACLGISVGLALAETDHQEPSQFASSKYPTDSFSYHQAGGCQDSLIALMEGGPGSRYGLRILGR